MPGLLAVLKGGSEAGQAKAAGAILSLANHRETRVPLFKTDGLVPSLVAVLEGGSERGQEKAAGAIVTVADHQELKVPWSIDIKNAPSR